MMSTDAGELMVKASHHVNAMIEVLTRSIHSADEFERDSARILLEGKVIVGGVALHHCTIDHYMPRAHGGSDSADNLYLACGPCNTRKGDKIPEEDRC